MGWKGWVGRRGLKGDDKLPLYPVNVSCRGEGYPLSAWSLVMALSQFDALHMLPGLGMYMSPGVEARGRGGGVGMGGGRGC